MEWLRVTSCGLRVAGSWLLRHFDYVVFSSAYQRDIYEEAYRDLPSHCVIENALPTGIPVRHEKHTPLRVLFLGRFVAFKRIPLLIEAIARQNTAVLTLAGSGPMQSLLERLVQERKIGDRVSFIGNRSGSEKKKLFAEHDVLVLPSLTEISPNVALEARSVGLPVLLTTANGLSTTLQRGMIVRDLDSVEQVMKALEELSKKYDVVATQSAEPGNARSWGKVAEEHIALFQSLTRT